MASANGIELRHSDIARRWQVYSFCGSWLGCVAHLWLPGVSTSAGIPDFRSPGTGQLCSLFHAGTVADSNRTIRA